VICGVSGAVKGPKLMPKIEQTNGNLYWLPSAIIHITRLAQIQPFYLEYRLHREHVVAYKYKKHYVAFLKGDKTSRKI